MKKNLHCYTCESTRRNFIKTAALGSVAVALPSFMGSNQLEAAAFNKAIDSHNNGDLKNAEFIYRTILDFNPNQPDANHNLGVLAVSVLSLIHI